MPKPIVIRSRVKVAEEIRRPEAAKRDGASRLTLRPSAFKPFQPLPARR